MTVARCCPGNPKEGHLTKCDLKKQSQFVAGQMNVSVLERKDYENKAHRGHRENKPQQSQMPAFGRKS
jgi:hypothetical protein